MRIRGRSLAPLALAVLALGAPVVASGQVAARAAAPADDVRLRWPAPSTEVRGFRLGSAVVVTRFAPLALPASPFARCLATAPAAQCANVLAAPSLPGLARTARGRVMPFATAVGSRVHTLGGVTPRPDTIRPGVVRVGIGFPF